jgi:hypothetical protein
MDRRCGRHRQHRFISGWSTRISLHEGHGSAGRRRHGAHNPCATMRACRPQPVQSSFLKSVRVAQRSHSPSGDLISRF